MFAGAAYVAAGVAPIITTAMASADMRAVDRLLGHNVRCYLQPSAHTHHFINQYDVGGNRTQQLAREAAPIRLAAAAATLRNADWLHVGPLMPNDIAPELWQQLRYQPQPVAVDIQGCLRQRRGHLLYPGASQLAPALHAANILKADRSEWDSIVAWHQRCGYADRGQSNHRNAASTNAIAGVLRFWNIDLLLLTEGHQVVAPGAPLASCPAGSRQPSPPAIQRVRAMFFWRRSLPPISASVRI